MNTAVPSTPLTFAPDAERAVIGCMLIEPETVIRPVMEAGGAELFYNPVYKVMCSALDHLHEHGEGVDQLTVADRLRRSGNLDNVGGEASIIGIMNETGSAANVDYHIGILREKLLLRKLLTALKKATYRCNEAAAAPEEILDSLKSELHELREFEDRKCLSLADQIREWIDVTKGEFIVTDCYKDLHLVTKRDKDNCRKILSRLCDEGMIEPCGIRRGHFRRIEGECERIDWKSADEDVLDFRWPGGVERYVEVMPGNVVVIAGEPNAGKTAYLLNVVRMNMARHDIHYFTSEMGAAEFRKRLSNFSDVALDASVTWPLSLSFHFCLLPCALSLSLCLVPVFHLFVP
ncbi:replicative DNA helicase [bacterium]|nr:replicative DNA helicase [bacterium]